MKKLITISIPVFNEEGNITRLLDRLSAFTNTEPKYNFEFLFTDNNSSDNTYQMLLEAAQNDKRIRVLKFSRNFGFQKSILANFQHARGSAAIQLDADLQDPPEMCSDFLRSWEMGAKVVYGIRRKRKEFFLLNIARNIFYTVIDSLAEFPIPRGAGDFRLIDRVILDHIACVTEQTPYLRGLIADLGYSQIGIVYDRQAREAGTSKFGILKLIEFGIDGLTSQSVKILRYMTIFGVAICLMAFIVTFVSFFTALFGIVKWPSGYASIVMLLMTILGINSLFLGILGEYIGRIFNNTRNLPMTVIEKSIDQSKETTEPNLNP